VNGDGAERNGVGVRCARPFSQSFSFSFSAGWGAIRENEKDYENENGDGGRCVTSGIGSRAGISRGCRRWLSVQR
jgi:hypothetical protein